MCRARSRMEFLLKIFFEKNYISTLGEIYVFGWARRVFRIPRTRIRVVRKRMSVWQKHVHRYIPATLGISSAAVSLVFLEAAKKRIPRRRLFFLLFLLHHLQSAAFKTHTGVPRRTKQTILSVLIRHHIYKKKSKPGKKCTKTVRQN